MNFKLFDRIINFSETAGCRNEIDSKMRNDQKGRFRQRHPSDTMKCCFIRKFTHRSGFTTFGKIMWVIF